MLCDKKHSHVQWRDFKMNVLVCDDDQQIVDSIIEELKKKSEETHVALRFYGFSQPSQIDLSFRMILRFWILIWAKQMELSLPESYEQKMKIL